MVAGYLWQWSVVHPCHDNYITTERERENWYEMVVVIVPAAMFNLQASKQVLRYCGTFIDCHSIEFEGTGSSWIPIPVYLR